MYILYMHLHLYSTYLPVILFFYLFMCLFVSIYLSLHLSICLCGSYIILVSGLRWIYYLGLSENQGPEYSRHQIVGFLAKGHPQKGHPIYAKIHMAQRVLRQGFHKHKA